ncbi:MAG: hypothetical protein AAGK00_12485 [Pseudomonadota bacterium]
MAYRITPATLEILELLARYRYLRKSFIDGLLTHRSRQGMNRTLLRMTHAGLIARPRSQFRGYNSLYCCYVYEITPRGWNMLRDREIAHVTNLIRARQDAPVKQFAHAMMICDALASIEIGVTDAGHAFIPLGAILARTTDKHPLKLPCRVQGREDRLAPDALFGVRRDARAYFYALEAEHYNPVWPSKDLRRASFRKKAIAYDHIARSKPYKDRLKIPNLHYLFVFPSKARAQTAHDHVLRTMPNSRFIERFYAAHIPVQEELLKAPPPFPQLYRNAWLGSGRMDED